MLALSLIAPAVVVVHAANPSVTFYTQNQTTTGASSITVTTPVLNLYGGDTFFVQGFFSDTSVRVTSVTDSLACTSWGKAVQYVTPSDASFVGSDAEVWFGTIPAGGCSGSATITVNVSPNFGFASVMLSYANTGVGFVRGATAGGACSMIYCSQVGSFFVTIPANAIIIGGAWASCIITGGANCSPGGAGFYDSTGGGTPFGFSTGTVSAPTQLSKDGLGSTGNGCNFGGGTCYAYGEVQAGWSYYQTSPGSAGYQMGGGNNGGGNTGQPNQQADGHYFVFEDYVAVFTSGGAQPPSCSGPTCQFSQGGLTTTGSTFALVAGNVYLFTGTTSPQSTIQVQNVTLKVHDVATATTSLTLALYEAWTPCPLSHSCGGYTVGSTVAQGNTATVSPSNPLKLVASVTYSLGVTATPFYLHWTNLNVLLNGTTEAVGVSTQTGGGVVTVFQSSTGAMSSDTTDGYNPAGITAYSSASPAISLVKLGTIPSVTVQQVVIGATTTVTTTQAGAASNQTVNTNNLMLGVIVLLGPAMLIAGVTKTLWGGILGAVLGLCIGVLAGFLPIWTVAVVLIVCMVALFFGGKSNGGGL